MGNALILRAPSALTAPGPAPRLIHSLTVPGAERRYVAGSATVAANAPVLSIPDITGSGIPLTGSGSAAPTLGQAGIIPFLHFDGVNDRMDAVVGGLGHAQPVSVIAVGRFNGAQPADVAWPMVNLHTNPSGRHVGRYVNGKLHGQFPTVQDTPHTIDNGWHVLTMVVNGATSTLALDGSEVPVNLGAGLAAGFTMGRNAAATGFVPMDVAEVIVWPIALTAAQRSAERANLAKVYGL